MCLLLSVIAPALVWRPSRLLLSFMDSMVAADCGSAFPATPISKLPYTRFSQCCFYRKLILCEGGEKKKRNRNRKCVRIQTNPNIIQNCRLRLNCSHQLKPNLRLTVVPSSLSQQLVRVYPFCVFVLVCMRIYECGQV